MLKNVCCKVLAVAAAAALLAGSVAVRQAEAQPPAADAPKIDPGHPLVKPLEIAQASRKAVAQVGDFEATFSKREMVGGKLLLQIMHMKFRAEPLSVYFQFRKPHEGREVLYVEGQNGNNLLARETGLKSLVGTVELAPTSPRALEENRYPITRAGMARLLEGVIQQWESESLYGEVEVKYYNAKIGEMDTQMIETIHPVPRRQFKFHKTRLFIDKATLLPVRVEQYGFPSGSSTAPPLLEEYTYTDIKTNVGLTDVDFSPRNPRYAFGR